MVEIACHSQNIHKETIVFMHITMYITKISREINTAIYKAGYYMYTHFKYFYKPIENKLN